MIDKSIVLFAKLTTGIEILIVLLVIVALILSIISLLKYIRSK